jgi:hypothetical protein
MLSYLFVSRPLYYLLKFLPKMNLGVPFFFHKYMATKFGMTPNEYVGFLFIHGLLHLKGYSHGDTMDKAEKKYSKRFKLANQ